MPDRSPGVDDPTKGPPKQATLSLPTEVSTGPSAAGAQTVVEYQGRFTLLAAHARGGLGEVFIAHDEALGRDVALKRLHERHADQPERRQRFLIEAELTARLEHPGIVPVHALTHDAGGRPCYTMRFIHGETFQQGIERFHSGLATAQGNAGNRYCSLEFRQLLQRFITVCHTMAYAHSRGVIHRDLKPANIMIGPYGETLVVDWGLAKVVSGACGVAAGKGDQPDASAVTTDFAQRTESAGLTKMGSAVGTPPFMSPEQAAGRWDVIGPQSDIYNLGATLSMLLTGQAPIQGRDEYEILQKVQSGDYPRPRQLKPEIPRSLEAACLKAMALKPAERYASATDLAQDLDRWLADEPVTAYAEPVTLRCRRWIKRHRTAVTATVAALLVALLLGGSVGAWYQWQRAETIRAADATLVEGNRCLERGHWAGARATLERAEALLSRTTVDRLRQGVEQIRADLDLVARLHEIHLQEPEVGPDQVMRRRPGEAYQAAFRSAGMGILEEDPTVLAEWLRASTIRRELVSALDRWSAYTEDEAQKQRLRDLARTVDPDPERNQVRDALTRKDQPALKQLAGRTAAAALPPTTVVLLAEALEDDNDKEPLLRAAQRRHPDDFWLNHDLAVCLRTQKNPRTAEAIGFYRAALALRPESHITHYNLGVALRADKQSAEAAAAFQKTIDLQPRFAMAHNNLGAVLLDQGKNVEAEDAFRRAIELKPDLLIAHQNLLLVLQFTKNYGGVEKVVRKALETWPANASLHVSLAQALEQLDREGDAAAAYGEACRLEPANPEHHYNHGCLLEAIRDDLAALAAYDRALALKPDFAMAHCNQAVVLAKLGRRTDAIAAYHRALKIQPDDAIAYYGLGRALCNDGQFAESQAALRRALNLGPKDASWQYRLAADPAWNDKVNGWVRKAERLGELDRKLAALLRNEARPADPAETLNLANLCAQDYKRLYATSAGLYADAFAAKPELAERIDTQHRYNAACAAALAASGQGPEAGKLPEPARARWRKQALDWLRADLAVWSRKLAAATADERGSITAALEHWLGDPDLAGLRDHEQRSKLPAPEQAAWQQLWDEVAGLVKRAKEGG